MRAGAVPPKVVQNVRAASGSDRRSFMKKAAVGGAVAWVAPTVVSGPAFAVGSCAAQVHDWANNTTIASGSVFTVGPTTFTFAFAGNAYGLQFDDVRWSDDLAVSGTARSVYGTGSVEARISAHGVSHGKLFIRWNSYARHAVAEATGTLDGQIVRASVPAP